MTRVTDTSMIAYENIKHLLSEKQDQVLSIFKLDKDKSWTNMELARTLGWDINRVTPRTNELRKMGMVQTKGKRQCTITGNTAYQMYLGWVKVG